MNDQIRRLTVVIALMFLALMVSATTVQFAQAGDLNADGRNVRTFYREFGRDRGPIVVAGTPIVTSEPVDDAYNYLRRYEQGPAYAHLTGYFSVVHSSMTGLERSGNEVLNGNDPGLLVARIQALVTGNQPRGGALELTIDPAAQAAAIEGLGDQRGAVVALDPRTGAILAMYSSPSFDPNPLASHVREEATTAYDELANDPDRPLLNRAIGGDQYAPGSTFKLVTAAAMVENGLTADSMVEAPTEYQLPQTQTYMHNPGEAACGDGSGSTTLRQALVQSCNTPFAIGAVDLGTDEINEQAEAFGFGQELAVPLPVTPSRFPADATPPELAQSSIGQFSVRTHPLQMAMVSSAIANDGVLMTPYLVQRTLTADLEEVDTHDEEVFSEPISERTAEEMTSMMIDVVEQGSSNPGAIPGVSVAGKTGSAEIDANTPPHAWYTGFAPADDPQVAVAVIVENGGNVGWGVGGAQIAAPIAASVMEAVLQ
ncbi:peptidoglycan D,D-transpeptidase FtsI family protein [Georgenia sp. Z1344]|uniref:peptidoglycan D,D-transpeptidase FtsI family protein n=1 Tax=Georgenia sp. Z1344 TaxID=3416706 RepID=UPI003CEA0066